LLGLVQGFVQQHHSFAWEMEEDDDEVLSKTSPSVSLPRRGRPSKTIRLKYAVEKLRANLTRKPFGFRYSDFGFINLPLRT
jgi:hypothetical protein